MTKPKQKVYTRNKQLPCRVNDDEMRHIIASAKKYTDGNVSEFVRTAALNFKPTIKNKR